MADEGVTRRLSILLAFLLAGSNIFGDPTLFYEQAVTAEKSGDVKGANIALDKAIQDAKSILDRIPRSETGDLYALIKHSEEWDAQFGTLRVNPSADLAVRKTYFFELLNAIINQEERRKRQAEQEDRNLRRELVSELQAIRELLERSDRRH